MRHDIRLVAEAEKAETAEQAGEEGEDDRTGLRVLNRRR